MKYYYPNKARAKNGAAKAWFYKEDGVLAIVVELNPGCKSGIVEIQRSQLRNWLKEPRP